MKENNNECWNAWLLKSPNTRVEFLSSPHKLESPLKIKLRGIYSLSPKNRKSKWLKLPKRKNSDPRNEFRSEKDTFRSEQTHSDRNGLGMAPGKASVEKSWSIHSARNSSRSGRNWLIPAGTGSEWHPEKSLEMAEFFTPSFRSEWWSFRAELVNSDRNLLNSARNWSELWQLESLFNSDRNDGSSGRNSCMNSPSCSQNALKLHRCFNRAKVTSNKDDKLLRAYYERQPHSKFLQNRLNSSH